MKICVYDWALHTIGGGQRNSCKIAEHLSKRKGNDMDLLTLFRVDKKTLEYYYSADLSKVNLLYLYPGFKKKDMSILHLTNFKKISELSGNYDLFFSVQGHETVKPLSKYSILFCHFPERAWYRSPKNFIDRIKLILFFLYKKSLRNYAPSYDKVVGNSQYTQGWIKRLWGVNAEYLYLTTEIKKIKYGKKENWITSAGRLTPDKGYEFMIDCFKKIYDSGVKNYKYIICGLVNDQNYLKKLEELSRGYPIEFKTDLSDDQLVDIYSKSKIFFHAKGYGINENKTPQLAEHFGMATLEAMGYGCAPVTVKRGGQKEIVRDNQDGFLYLTQEEAIKSLLLIMQNEKLRKKFSEESKKRAQSFSLKIFQKNIDKIVGEVLSKEK